jgi:hypothetical protein
MTSRTAHAELRLVLHGESYVGTKTLEDEGPQISIKLYDTLPFQEESPVGL